MRASTGALIGGAVGSALVLGFFAWRKVDSVKSWAAELQAGAQGDPAAQSELAEYAGYLRQRLTAVATEHTTVVARQAADQTLGEYGLSPDRIEKIQRLARSFGV